MSRERFQLREGGPGWEWLPRYCIVDTLRQVRVAAYDDKVAAELHLAELRQQEEK